jgi:ADP-ribose pyrophosphatase
MKIEILTDETPFREFFHVRKARLRFERFDGSMSPEVIRYSFSKWDAVAVLVYQREWDAYLLVRQMRFPPVQHDIDPWITEIVAGGITPGENEQAAAEREVVEETGYRPLSIQRVMKFYVSPGIMSERIALFYAEVDETSKDNEGGGLLHEDEDIELIRVPRSEVMQWIAQQEFGDAKTIVALQWHLNAGRK